LPEIPEKNLLSEPMPRSTAPCVRLCLGRHQQKISGCGDACPTVRPTLSGTMNGTFETLMKRLRRQRRRESGHSRHPPHLSRNRIRIYPLRARHGRRRAGCRPVRRFVEKPFHDTAKAYLASEINLWNSRNVYLKLSTHTQSGFGSLCPTSATGFSKSGDAWDTPAFRGCAQGDATPDFRPSRSITASWSAPTAYLRYRADFGWDDAGSFLVFERINKADKNATRCAATSSRSVRKTPSSSAIKG
jgi:mannose-1-phosphate guanylyltransferase